MMGSFHHVPALTAFITDMPMILAGNACGRIQQGLHYRSHTGENVNKVMLSLIRALGINAPGYGQDEGEVSNGLSAIEV